MKNILKHAVPAIWALLATLCGQTAAAAIDAKISFETEIPKAFVCGENSAAELSGLHYKDGSRSLRWSWSAPSTLRFNDFGQLMRSLSTWISRAGAPAGSSTTTCRATTPRSRYPG